MSGKAQQQSRIKELITLGREQKYLTYAEVNDHLPEDISDPEQVEDIIRMINDMGIPVHESAPDADALMLADADTDEAAAEEAAPPHLSKRDIAQKISELEIEMKRAAKDLRFEDAADFRDQLQQYKKLELLEDNL